MKKFQIAGFDIEGKFKFQLMSYAAAIMHFTFLVMFVCFHMYALVCVNIVSICLYVAGGIVSSKKDVSLYARKLLTLMFLEILFHSTACTLIQGVEVCFFLYPMMALPVGVYYLFIYCEKKTFIRTTLCYGIIITVVMTLTLCFVRAIGSIYELTGFHTITITEVTILSSVNIFFNIILLICFSLVFYVEVSTLLGRLKETNDKLNYIATHDSLTGLTNRHSLWDFFDGLEKSGEHYCIVMGDLDDFKKINDTYGHDCGDLVLKSVADVVLKNTKEGEIACRWGGEEILIIMRGGKDECYSRISTVKSGINSLGIIHEGRQIAVTMTFGLAGSDERDAAVSIRRSAEKAENTTDHNCHHIGIDSLITMVDKRLYAGKRSGKNVIVAVD